MNFVNFKVPASDIAGRLADLRASFAASGKTGPFESYAVRVIGERMRRHPDYYVEFGPYWWAVKAVLNAAGNDMGDAGDPIVIAEYRGASDIETLVAAEAFKDYYRATFIVGTAAFDLADDGNQYELADADMQARVAAV